MRRLLVALALLVPMASAGDPYAVLLDWQHGESLVGTTTLAMSPLSASFAFEVDACRRAILVDLLYAPDEAGGSVDGVGEAFLQFEFLAEVWAGEERLAQQRIRQPAYGIPFGTTNAAGPHEVRLSLANGANVSWDLRVRAREVFGDLACEPRVLVNEVEADPAGPDAGFEWVELYNAGDEAADLSAWTLRATHGSPAELTLPNGLSLAPRERVVVTFADGQAIDNADEVVELWDAFGRLRDATPAQSDGKNDGRSWQRAPDGSPDWTFAAATPNAGNRQAPEGS